MIHLILFSLSIGVLLLTWFLYRRNIELFLILLIALNFELFYFIPGPAGAGGYQILLLPILVILTVERILFGRFSSGRYGIWLLLYVGISFIGLVVASLYGQPLLLGIKAAKFVPLIFIYFLVNGREVDGIKFSKYFILMSLVIAGFTTIQYFLPPNQTIFLNMPEAMKLARQESPRLTIGQLVIPVASVMAYAIYRQSSHKGYLILSLLLFLQVFFVQQTRMLIAGVLLSLLIVHLLFTSGMSLQRLSAWLLLTGLLLIGFIILGSELSRVAMVQRTKEDVQYKRGSYHARILAYQHYWGEIFQRPLWGRGLLNFNWKGNQDRYLQQHKNLHLSDIGTTQFFVQSGLLGIIWFLFGFVKIWGDLLLRQRKSLWASYIVLATITMPTIDLFLRTDSLMPFCLFLGLLSTDISRRVNPIPTVRTT